MGNNQSGKQRRENGQGSIYKRGDRYIGRLMIGIKENGKQEVKYFSGKSEPEVKRKIREYNNEHSNTKKTTVTLSEYMSNWLDLYKRPTLKPSSYDRIENTFRYQIKPELGMIQMQALSSDHIQKFLNGLKDDGFSYSSIKKAHDCLNACLNHATISDVIQKNPMMLVKMPPKSSFNSKEIRWFSVKEVNAIVEECARKHSTGAPVYIYADVFILMLNTGLRMGEAVGLEKVDWDQDQNTLHIRRNVQTVKLRDKDGNAIGGMTLSCNTTKTYSGDRILPLNKNATEALRRLCGDHPNSKYVVCGKDGNQIPPERIERTFYRLLDNVGIKRTGVHSLRHTFASTLFGNGVDVKTVSSLLGHASIQITLNTYIHLINGIDAKSVEKLDNII